MRTAITVAVALAIAAAALPAEAATSYPIVGDLPSQLCDLVQAMLPADLQAVFARVRVLVGC